MALTYHSGRRIQGTAADRVGQSAVSGGWKELGRTTLGSAGDDIDITSLPDKRYYHILVSQLPTGSAVGKLTLNNDSGSNYARRFSVNGASDTAQSSIAEIGLTTTETNPNFQSIYLANLSSKEKLGLVHNVRQNTAGAGNAPNRAEQVFKWANTSSAINRVDVYNSSTGSFDTGSEVVVLGYDPDDTHTDNFWEELADITLGSDASEISSGTITAKKYLWVQVYFQNASNSNDVLVRFNNDTGSNYAHRHAINYGSDTTQTSGTSIKLIDRNGAADTGRFVNFFAINHSAKEKLLIAHGTEEETTGAGNPPTSNECVAKWANTSSQITEIDCFTESGNIRSGARLKVWGSN